MVFSAVKIGMRLVNSYGVFPLYTKNIKLFHLHTISKGIVSIEENMNQVSAA
jgi:hypothetical protein